MRRRAIVIPIAAATIAGLCAYKLAQTYPPQADVVVASASALPAPPFELLNSDTPSEVVRLDSFLSRHRIVLVFFDGSAGADHDPILARLREKYDTLHADGTLVIAVSTALPQDNRKIFAKSGEFPFPLLSDPALEAHRKWGLLDEKTGEPRTGVFIIDRKGEVASLGGVPQPLPHPQQAIEQLLAGE